MTSSDDQQETKTVRVDEATVMQAGEAGIEDGTIECPNGCYEPRPVTHGSLHAAAELPKCKECGEVHVLKWVPLDE